MFNYEVVLSFCPAFCIQFQEMARTGLLLIMAQLIVLVCLAINHMMIWPELYCWSHSAYNIFLYVKKKHRGRQSQERGWLCTHKHFIMTHSIFACIFACILGDLGDPVVWLLHMPPKLQPYFWKFSNSQKLRGNWICANSVYIPGSLFSACARELENKTHRRYSLAWPVWGLCGHVKTSKVLLRTRLSWRLQSLFL